MKFLEKLFGKNNDEENNKEIVFGNHIDAYKKEMPEELRGEDMDLVQCIRAIRNLVKEREKLALNSEKAKNMNIVMSAGDRFIEENHEHLATAI